MGWACHTFARPWAVRTWSDHTQVGLAAHTWAGHRLAAYMDFEQFGTFARIELAVGLVVGLGIELVAELVAERVAERAAELVAELVAG